MQVWWLSLAAAEKFFWLVAIFATVLQVLLLAGSAFGDTDHDSGAHGGDGDGHGAHGLKLLSVRTVTAFLVGFGWAGALGLGSGLSAAASAAIAVLSGIVFGLLILGTLKLLISLRSDGTLDYRNAVGVAGKVYVTVPAARAGTGQVELLLQGRLITADAATESAEPLAPMSPVRVVAVEPGNVLVVQPTAALTEP
jgi:hypothetical protein